MIALGILTIQVPRLRANRARILTATTGAVMAISGAVNMMFARHPDNFSDGVFLVVLGSAMLLQAIYWHSRRTSGLIAGAGVVIAGLGLAASCLDPDKLVLAWRYYLFGFGELLVIVGAIIGAGAWQGWLLPPVEADGDAIYG